MHFIRPVGNSQSAHARPRRREERVLRYPRASVRLYGPIQHPQRNMGRDNFNHRDFRPRRFVPHHIHHICGFQRQQTCLFDLRARLCDNRANRTLLGKRLTESHARLHTIARRFQGALCHSDASHAMMDASGPQPPLRDLESTPFAEQDV